MIPKFRFVRDCLLNGLGMLIVTSPAINEAAGATPQENPMFTRHFYQVGNLLYSSIAAEAPDLLTEFQEGQRDQLELGIHV